MGVIERYISSNLKKGYSIVEIKQALRDAGYSDEVIEAACSEVLTSSPSKIMYYFGGFILFAVSLFLIILYVMGASEPVYCEDVDCFILWANACSPVYMIDIIDGSEITYSADNCVLTKEITYASPQSPLGSFKGTMSCEFEPGEFDFNLLNGLTGGMQYCKGPLKEAIKQLAPLIP